MKNEGKEQKCGFPISLLGTLLTGKGTIRACKETFKAGQEF